jgi:hypothetical protein
MWILMLEAGGALLLLVFLVWWTMFSGRDAADRGDAAPAARQEHRNEHNTPER